MERREPQPRMSMRERFETRSREAERVPERAEEAREEEVTERVETKLAGDAKYERATELMAGLRDYADELKAVMHGGEAPTAAMQAEIQSYRRDNHLDSDALAAVWLKGDWIAEAKQNVGELLLDPTLPSRDRRALEAMNNELYRVAMNLEGNRFAEAA